MGFVDELLGEQNAAGLGDGDRRRAKMLAEEAPELSLTYTQATSQRAIRYWTCRAMRRGRARFPAGTADMGESLPAAQPPP
jgi:hypothetical protein